MKRWPLLAAWCSSWPGAAGVRLAARPRCGAVDRGELPSWATAGFSDAHPSAPHVVGRGGADHRGPVRRPARRPARQGALQQDPWVARRPVNAPGALKIRTRDGSRVVDRTLQSGVGPSIVDLPAGCWTLDLSWSDGGHDTLMLRYAQGKPS